MMKIVKPKFSFPSSPYYFKNKNVAGVVFFYF